MLIHWTFYMYSQVLCKLKTFNRKYSYISLYFRKHEGFFKPVLENTDHNGIIDIFLNFDSWKNTLKKVKKRSPTNIKKICTIYILGKVLVFRIVLPNRVATSTVALLAESCLVLTEMCCKCKMKTKFQRQ